MATMYTQSTSRGGMLPSRQPHHGASHPQNSQVRFGSGANKDEVMQERQKYLTAKYGAEQMKLIRKRLAVEDWLDQQLRRLYDVQSDMEHYDCIDLDELLDIDEDRHRRRFIQERIANSRKSQEVINVFVTELVEKVNPLNSLKTCLKKQTLSNPEQPPSDGCGSPNPFLEQRAVWNIQL